ncbi:transmembrane protein 154 isoform X2 [Nothobranchius furzeri]|uniref:Transcript variant X2 n=1 Tax=Nothobranchius furzeri TaxID=105023 RepID=A0A9D2Y683_NOTFU|nr:transmembrane protein 154 isoform X2 [Nothobranchius furzeri]KAF7214333.1 transcript variant X2 [Nothobranchius furzeri]
MWTSLLATMRSPWLKTPQMLVVLVLVLSGLTGKAFCIKKEDIRPSDLPYNRTTPKQSGVNSKFQDAVSNWTTGTPTKAPDTLDLEAEVISGDVESDPTDLEPVNSTTPSEEEDWTLDPLIILIPVVLAVVIISVIVCGIYINRRCNQNEAKQELSKADPYLEASSTEKVPMPMFEEDVPSVLELEMDELDQWIKKDS